MIIRGRKFIFSPAAVTPPAGNVVLTVQFASTPTLASSSFENLKYGKHSMINFEWDDASRDALTAKNIFDTKYFTDGTGSNKNYSLAVAVNGRAQFDNREIGLNPDLGITYQEGLNIIAAGGDIQNHAMYHDPTGNFNNGTNALLNMQQLEQLYFDITGYRMNALVVPTNYSGYMQAAFDEGYVCAASESTFDSFTAQPTGFDAVGTLNDIPEGFIAFDRQFTDDWASRLVEFKSYIDQLLTGTSSTTNKWFRIGSHGISSVPAFTELVTYLEAQANDNIWVTTMREYAEYKLVKNLTVKTEQLVNNTLTITLDQTALSNRIRWKDMTLKISSDANIQNITMSGTGFTKTNNLSSKLINIFKQS